MGMMDFRLNKDVYNSVREGRADSRNRRYVEQGLQSIPQVLGVVQQQIDRQRQAGAAKMIAQENGLPESYAQAFANQPGVLASLIMAERAQASKRSEIRNDTTRQYAFEQEMAAQKQAGAMDLQDKRNEGIQNAAAIRSGGPPRSPQNFDPQEAAWRDQTAVNLLGEDAPLGTAQHLDNDQYLRLLGQAGTQTRAKNAAEAKDRYFKAKQELDLMKQKNADAMEIWKQARRVELLFADAYSFFNPPDAAPEFTPPPDLGYGSGAASGVQGKPLPPDLDVSSLDPEQLDALIQDLDGAGYDISSLR